MQLRLPWSTPLPPARADRTAVRERTVTIDGETCPVQIARHPSARRYILRVTAAGAVRLTVPRGASIGAGLAFVAERVAWIAAERRRLLDRQTWGEGTRVWFRGELVSLVVETARVTCGGIAIGRPPGSSGNVRPLVQAHLRALASVELPVRSRALATLHGLEPTRISVRDQRSRWGSCSARGAVALNWRLVQMPPVVADYVILHELAHLTHPNHSRRFWRHVATLCPAWREAERWLRRYGRELL